MQTQEIAPFSALIDAERLQVLEEIAMLERQSAPVAPDCALGTLGRFEIMHDQAIPKALLQRAHERLLKLEHAAHRVAIGSYGSCLSCGEPIETPRLLLLPESTLCMECAREVR